MTLNVAIFPCGSEAGLEVHNALQHDKTVRLFGASGVRCHGEALFENYDCSLPFIDKPDFEDKLNAYLRANKIDYLFPAYDDVIVKLAEMGDRLAAKAVIPDAEVCRIARMKSLTYAALKSEAFCPWHTTDPSEVDRFPVFAKPDQGQGSQGIALIRSQDELDAAETGGLVFCEHLPGAEYTIDCFTDSKGALQVCAPRVRQRVKSGISVRTASVETSAEIRAIAERILVHIPFRGIWFFQLKHAEDGTLKLLEVAPRVAGSMATTRARGSNLPLMALYDLEGYDVQGLDNGQPVLLERYLGNRFIPQTAFDRVYIDFDDTVTKADRANIDVMRFLYHCANLGKRLILITRHARDIHQTLADLHIAASLFDEVIHITDKSPKSGHIAPDGAIFIDDSFAERADVARVHGIPVFGVDAVESLIDWRQA